MILPCILVKPHENLLRWWVNEKSVVFIPFPLHTTQGPSVQIILWYANVYSWYMCRCLYWCECTLNICACVTTAWQVRLISRGYTNIDRDLLFGAPNDNGKVYLTENLMHVFQMFFGIDTTCCWCLFTVSSGTADTFILHNNDMILFTYSIKNISNTR
jgi:hypothetical protein